MKFLGAENEFDAGHLEKFGAAALGHATHEAERLAGPAAAGFDGEILHAAESLLLGGIAHTAGVEENDVGKSFTRGESIAASGQLSGDSFAIALIHLATVSFDKNARHPKTRSGAAKYVRERILERAESFR